MTDKQPNDERTPENLLTGVNRSIFLKALVISAGVHIVFAGVTSFSLYGKWAEHGFYTKEHGILSPSDIREIEQEAAKAKREKEQDAEIEARLEEQRKQAELQVGEETAESEQAPTPEPASTPEVPEIEPLPPADGFSLEDIGLD